jgi:putative addiction module killer protein
VSGAVSELRVDHGPGFRVYFVQHAEAAVVLLCDGDKTTQARDIATAYALARSL